MRVSLKFRFFYALGAALATVTVARCATPPNSSPTAGAVKRDTVTDTEEMLYRDPTVRTMYRLRQLLRLAGEYEVTHGAPAPALIKVLPADLDSVEQVRALEDSWSRSIEYELSDSAYQLRSAGPDGRLRTVDDLVLRGPRIPGSQGSQR